MMVIQPWRHTFSRQTCHNEKTVKGKKGLLSFGEPVHLLCWLQPVIGYHPGKYLI
jgi:hypothetical protein